MNTISRGAPLLRFLRFPLVWLAIGVITVGALSTFVGAGTIPTILAVVTTLAAYGLVMRFVARRPMPELALRHALRDALIGAAIGAGFLAVSVGIITLLGGYRFTFDPTATVRALPGILAILVGGAVTEELLFRGLALQAIEKLGGSWIALGATAVLFGLIHAANPAATLWSSIAIAVEAGGLLGAAFLWRRSLWLVFALHATWNGLEQALGIPVSGHADPGVLIATVQGPAILTGGDFGLEASLVPMLVSLAITALLLVAAHRRGSLVPRTAARSHAMNEQPAASHPLSRQRAR
ncbi:CPBP family intramembrane metalloprotease [Microbacterium protaetiae]|uniref:CPBP family intramembrane metalloprotease n=1 Tax=Microbacterium protaetiae TaxID=2509458 RepID=A0A4P6EE27_9MICO|nr:type II CAAX endopeptidase family protein [Microbacterium protaetiae]QAY59603.1 CPBP family intramembrane metalloprotease [Microbacterium protaetiae]